MTPVRQQRTAGFSVVEALIGVAVVGVAFIPLVEMQSQITRQYQRQAMLEDRLLAQRNALALLADVNVMAEPTGRRSLTDGRVLRWSTTPLTAESRSLRFLGGEGDFEVALFEVHAEIRDPRQSPMRFSIEQLGWRRVTES